MRIAWYAVDGALGESDLEITAPLRSSMSELSIPTSRLQDAARLLEIQAWLAGEKFGRIAVTKVAQEV